MEGSLSRRSCSELLLLTEADCRVSIADCRLSLSFPIYGYRTMTPDFPSGPKIRLGGEKGWSEDETAEISPPQAFLLKVKAVVRPKSLNRYKPITRW